MLEANIPQKPRTSREEEAQEQRMLEHIANFSGSLRDLEALFGEQVAGRLERWRSAGLVEVDAGAAEEVELFVSSEKGMRQAGFPNWSAGLWEARDKRFLERGGARGRLVASVAGAVAIRLAREGEREQTNLLSMWGARRRGRDRKGRFQFESALRGRRHYPAAVIEPRNSLRRVSTVIEVFDGTEEDSDIESVCRMMNRRADVGGLRCYAKQASVDVLCRMVRELDAREKIEIYALGDAADAESISMLEPEVVGSRSVLSSEDRALQRAVLGCVGEFGSASVIGLREYFALEKEELDYVVENALDEGLLAHPLHSCDGVKLLWLTAAGASVAGVKMARGAVGIEQARLEKESLRVAGLLMARYPGSRVTNARTLARSRKLMPALGPAELGYRPALLVGRKQSGQAPAAAMIVLDVLTKAQLKQMVKALSEAKAMSEIVIYAIPGALDVLGELVRAEHAERRVIVEALPVSERVVRARMAEQKRAAGVLHTQTAKESRERRLREKAEKELGARVRKEVHAPELAGLKPISEKTWEAFSSRLSGQIGPSGQSAVSTRLVVNVLIWVIENEVRVNSLRSTIHGLSPQVFRARLDALYRAGLWGALQSTIEQYEDRGPLDWSRITPVVTKREATLEKRRSGFSAGERDLFEELERLTLAR